MLTRLSLLVRIRWVPLLVPVAMLCQWAGWYFTRSWQPLNMPISLARGHIRAEFDINVESVYEVDLRLNSVREQERPPCSDGSLSCVPVSFVRAHWSVSQGRRTVMSGEGEPGWTFEGQKGHYVFLLDIPEDQSWLNFYEPRLVIYEFGGKANNGFPTAVGELLLLALFLSVPVGACLLVFAAIHRRQNELAEVWKSYPFTQASPSGAGSAGALIRTSPLRFPRPKSGTVKPFSTLSTQSLVLVLTLFTVWASLVVGTSLELPLPHGLPIRTVRPGVEIPRPPGIEPLMVRVTANGLFIGSESVPLDALGPSVKRELRLRPPDWPVYVQGDSDLEWRQVAEVIDAIRGSEADVILLPHGKSSK